MKTLIKLISIMGFLSLTACAGIFGQNNDISGSNSKDPVVVPYFEAYLAAAKFQGKSLNLPTYLSIQLVDTFGEGNANQVGLCRLTRSSSGTSVAEVTLLRSAFMNYSEIDRRILAWHELTHCIMFRGHTNEWISINGYSVPKSIMYPYTLGSVLGNLGLRSLLPDLMTNYYEREMFMTESSTNTSMKMTAIAEIENEETGEVNTVVTTEFRTNKDMDCENH